MLVLTGSGLKATPRIAGDAGRARCEAGPTGMKLADLPTPCLVLDRAHPAAQSRHHGARGGAAMACRCGRT